MNDAEGHNSRLEAIRKLLEAIEMRLEDIIELLKEGRDRK